MNELSWSWIALALTVPSLIGVLVAIPFWRKGQMILGCIAGTAVILSTAIGLILREYVELDRLVNDCLDAGTTCFPNPGAFTRFAIYACIGLLEVFGLFTLSLLVEERIRRRDYAPEWRVGAHASGRPCGSPAGVTGSCRRYERSVAILQLQGRSCACEAGHR